MWGVIVFAVAFLPRLFYLLSIQASPLFNYLAPDSLSYYQLASKWAAGQTVGDAILFRAPLYPYLLTLYYWVFGQSLFVPLLLQSILGAFACVMVYLIARHYYANKIAVTAGLMAALCGPLIFFGGELLPFTLALTLNLIAIWLLTLYEESRKRSQMLVAGLLLGLSAAAHPAVLLFAPIVVLWIHQRLSQNRQEWIKQTMPFVIGILIVLVPVAMHNAIAGGETVVFETYGGVNFGAGNNTQADGGKPVLPGTLADAQPGIDVASALASQQTGRKLTATETGSYWLGQGFKYIFTQPLSWIGLQMRKAAYLITGYEIPKDRQVYFFAKQSSVLRYLLWEKLIAFPFGILLPLALLALAAGSSLASQQEAVCVNRIRALLCLDNAAVYRHLAISGDVGSDHYDLVCRGILDAGSVVQRSELHAGSIAGWRYWLRRWSCAMDWHIFPVYRHESTRILRDYMFTGSANFNMGKYADAEQGFLHGGNAQSAFSSRLHQSGQCLCPAEQRFIGGRILSPRDGR